MAVIKTLDSTDRAYIDAILQLYPRGPIWDGRTTRTRAASEHALGAFITGTAAEPKRLHNRFVDLIAEADPRTTDELLAEWIEAWGLPAPCSSLPATDEGKRAQLTAKWRAQGGQSRAYYLGIVRGALRPYFDATIATEDLATITEQPYGVPFRVGSGAAGDPLLGEGAMFYWRIYAAADTPADVQATLECLLEHYKPAHTTLEWSWTLGYEVGP